MASSLEELLAEEGFRGRKSGTTPRTSVGSRTVSMPLYPLRDRHKKDFASMNRIKTERTRSDITRYSLRGEIPRSDSIRGGRPRDNLVRRDNMDGGSKQENRGRYDGRGSKSLQEGKRFSFSSVEDFSRNEIVEIGMEGAERFKDIYSNDAYSPDRGKDEYSNRIDKKEKYKERSGKDIKVGNKHTDIYTKHLPGRADYNPETSHNRSNRGSSNGTSFEENRRQRSEDVIQAVSELALDDVAVQAVVSILSGPVKHFLKDEDFRTTLHHNCFSSLDFVELEEGQNTESKVIMNLEEAIETVEQASVEKASAKDLKKASLQLSVITGLNSSDLKDGFTSGVPNSRLSACAHLYLSVIYKLQKKDRISAKHLLQVFADSPFQARTTLLPELWDYLFLPHLSHLKDWYNQEIESLADTPSKLRKLKFLEKVYNELLDSGTYQFAVYYKDWLTKGVEAPSIPSIQPPSISVQGVQHGVLHGHSFEFTSPSGAFSPQPMVSKKLYDAVFRRCDKPGVDEAEDGGEEDNFDNYMRSSGGSSVEVKHTLTHSSEMLKHADIDVEADLSKNSLDVAVVSEDGVLFAVGEESNLLGMSVTLERDPHDKIDKNSCIQQDTNDNILILHAPMKTEGNELTLEKLAKSILELQETKGLVDPSMSALSSSNQAPIPDSPSNAAKRSISFEELGGSYEASGDRSFFLSTPQDFICPLTGQLFEDPVSLETGQTFERTAISEWFNQGNRTCPVTGKLLDNIAVPRTNFVLKRLIDGWKSKHSSNLSAFASQIVENSRGHGFTHRDEAAIFMLEKLLSTFSKERVTNAKNLISIGGIEFLSQRFAFGNSDDKTRLAALLLHCIEADLGCRDQIATTINIRCLIELLHCKQIKSRTNAILLLTELVCLNRRRDVMHFLHGLQNEVLMNAMHVVLIYLQSSPPERRPLVAVLLLHLDFLVERRKYSIYREEAIDAITEALTCSLTNEKVRKECTIGLLILERNFSSNRLKQSLMLKETEFNDSCNVNYVNNKEGNLPINDSILLDDDTQASEEWLRNVSESLLGDGKKSFLEAISNCLGCRDSDLVRACLITVAWLSCALSSQSDAEFQLSAFLVLISQLKESLEHSEKVEHKILASMSLLNFSKIPECRVLLMTIAEEISIPLRSLAEVTWIAKQLYAVISGEDL